MASFAADVTGTMAAGSTFALAAAVAIIAIVAVIAAVVALAAGVLIVAVIVFGPVTGALFGERNGSLLPNGGEDRRRRGRTRGARARRERPVGQCGRSCRDHDPLLAATAGAKLPLHVGRQSVLQTPAGWREPQTRVYVWKTGSGGEGGFRRSGLLRKELYGIALSLTGAGD
jgi:hypothetical protein